MATDHKADENEQEKAAQHPAGKKVVHDKKSTAMQKLAHHHPTKACPTVTPNILMATDTNEQQKTAQHPAEAKVVRAQKNISMHVDATIVEALQTLGLEAGASLTEVKKAHRELARRLHPDAKGGSIDAFVKVQTAYELLTGKRSPDKTLKVHLSSVLILSRPHLVYQRKICH